MNNIIEINLPVEVFNFETVNNLKKSVVVEKKVVYDITDCIEYLNKYFYQVEGDFYFYDVSENKFKFYDLKDVCKRFFNKFDKDIKEAVATKNIIEYQVINNNFKPRLYKENNIRYINISEFYKLKNLVKPYSEFTDEIKNKVKLLLDYIFKVLANDDEDIYNYLLCWYSNLFKGKKNDSVLYLRSPEGAGKSTLPDYIIKFILGDSLATKCGTEPLKTPYNAILKGAILVVFEELPTFSKSEWIGVSSKLKDMVTSDTMIINEKYEKSFKCYNTNNYIVLSNHQAIQHSEGRRYFILDINTEYMNDHEYYGKLRNETFNNEVAKAFFNYILEIDTKNFYSQKMPLTENKKRAIEKSLISEYKFIRDQYIIKKKGLCGIKRTLLYEEFKSYCIDNKLIFDNKSSSFYEKLAEVNIKSIKNSTEIYKVDYETLLKIANNNKWLAGIEYNDDDNDNKLIDVKDSLKNEHIELIKENEELKNNYDELKKEYDILMSEKKDIETKYNNIIEQYFNKNDIIDNVYIKLQNEILQVKNMFDLKLDDQKLMINKKDNIICDLEKKLKKLKKKFKKSKNLNNDVLKNCISPLDYGIDSTESINTFDSTDTFESSFSDEIIISSNVKIDKELNPIKIKKNKIKKIYPGFENCELEDFLDVPYE
jgi:hypothetical protein